MEIFFSDELQIVLQERMWTETEEKNLQVYNITRIEPDSSRFIVPPNFKRLN